MPTIAMLIDRLSQAHCFDDVASVCARYLIRRGASRLSYHHRPPPGAYDHVGSLTVAAWNFPSDWVELYQRSDFWEIDPIPRLALIAAKPFWWSEISQLAELNARERGYLVALRRQRLGDGLAIPVFGPRGRDGYVAIGAPRRRHLWSDVAVGRLQIACQLGHQRYCQLLIGDDRPPKLSSREREVLTWMAAGKSNSVIGQILGVSAHTVDTYVRRLFQKLGTTDRVTAALRGHAIGLLD